MDVARSFSVRRRRTPFLRLALRWAGATTGVSAGRRRVLVGTFAGLAALVAALNVAVYAQYERVCEAASPGGLGRGAVMALSVAVTLAAVPAFGRSLRAAYAEPLFRTYGIGEKSAVALLASAGAGGAAGTLVALHAQGAARTCGYASLAWADLGIAAASSWLAAVLLVVLVVAVRVVPIEDTRITKDYAVMFDYALRIGAVGGGGRTARSLRPVRPGRAPGWLRRALAAAAAQAEAGAARPGKLVLAVVVAVLASAFAFGSARQGQGVAALVALHAAIFVLYEVMAMPEVMLDDRIRASGRGFADIFAATVGVPVLTCVATGGLGASFLGPAALGSGAAAAVIVTTRAALRIAFWGRRGHADLRRARRGRRRRAGDARPPRAPAPRAAAVRRSVDREAPMGGQGMSRVVLDDVTVKRGGAVVLSGVTAAFGEGRIVGIAGANGAGKTTLMGAMSGDVPYAAGSVTVLGREVVNDPKRTRRAVSVASVPRGPSEALTGLGYLRFAAMAEGYQAPSAAQVELAALTGLTPDLARPIRTYSHGTAKKLALVAAVGPEAPVLVLDEVFNGMDVVSLRAMRDFFRAMASEGALIFLCSHFLQILFGWCDEVAVIGGGGIARRWTREEIARFDGRYDDFEAEAIAYY